MFFKPKLIPTLFTVPALIVLLFLGSWQIHRLDWKNDRVREINSKSSMSALSLNSTDLDLSDAEFRRVKLEGTFLNENETHLYTGPRHFRGKPGYDILTPFETKEGDVLNPCITLDGECEKIDLECPGPIYRIGSGGILKGIFVGLGDHLFSNSERVYYTSTELPCRPIHKGIAEPGVNIPTQSELAAGRFFTPIFSALTLVIGFMLGKLLFNRNIGLMFSIILLFHSLWFHFSRTLLSEVYVSFFVMLAIYLLFYASSKKKFNYKYFLFSAVVFALAIDTKFTSLQTIPFIFIIISLRNSWNTRINYNSIKTAFSIKTFLLILLFSGILFISIIATFPYYWPDPIGQTFLQIESMNPEYYGGVTLHFNKKIILPMLESATIAPIIDGYYYIFSPDEIPQSATYGHTFSSIPLSIFFIVGLFWIFYKIKKRQVTYAEFIIFFWYVSLYITISILTESYNASRHFVPIIFPMILIMSYGVNNFLHRDFSKGIRILFWILIIFVHSITYLIFWEMIYFKPEMIWVLPTLVNLRESFSHPMVLFSGIVFVTVFSFLVFWKIKNSSRLGIIKNDM